MAQKSWNDDYLIGIDAMDRQHRRLFDLMDETYEALQQGRAAAESGMERILAGLIDYAREHFREEEFLLRRKKYPRLDEHLEHHRQLVNGLVKHIDGFRRQELPPLKLALFIRNWIVCHIVEEDRRYAKHILTRGD